MLNNEIDTKIKISKNCSLHSNVIMRNVIYYRHKKCLSLIEKEESALDIGFGEGHFLILLSKRIKNVYGIDHGGNPYLFADMVKWERCVDGKKLTVEIKKMFDEKKLNNVSILLNDACNLTFYNNKIENIFALEVFEHIKELESAIIEIHRVLKNEGILIISIPNTIGPAYKLRQITMKLFGMEENDQDHKNFNWKNTVILLQKYFDVEKIIGYPFGMKFLSPNIIIKAKKGEKYANF